MGTLFEGFEILCTDYDYVMANVELRLELSQLNSSPQVWG